ncbi:MAG: hypothetical protein U9Q98_03090 [Bacteroidota bacterium]|nr:hypothetical protein [Bacteroidota bacterium]
MLKQIKQLGLIVLFTSVIFYAKAQDRTSSPYTRYGLGDLMTKNFGDSRAMGGTSLALRNGSKLYPANPASYSSIDSLHFVMEAGISASVKEMSSPTNNLKQTTYDFNLDYLSFGFPVTNWWGAAFGMMPYSNVSYNVITSENSLGHPHDYHYQGYGGINQAFIGSSFEPIDNLSVGFNLNYLFGNIHQLNAVNFADSVAYGMVDITEEKILYFNNFYFSGGIHYDYPLSENHQLTLGMACDINSVLNVNRTYLATSALSSNPGVITDTLEHNFKEQGEINLPLNIGGGMAYHYKDVLIVAADFRYQDWSNASIFGEQDSLGAGQRVSLGLEYIPDGKNAPIMKYRRNIRYRMGAFFNDTYLEFDQGNTKVNNFGISFGLGLPLKRSNTTFNISLELGQRGSLKNNLVKENYAVLGVNFSLSDIWFIKHKYE